MTAAVTDTHALLWYWADDPRLSPSAAQHFAEAEAGTALIREALEAYFGEALNALGPSGAVTPETATHLVKTPKSSVSTRPTVFDGKPLPLPSEELVGEA